MYCIQYGACTNHCLGFQSDYKIYFFLILNLGVCYQIHGNEDDKILIGKMG